MKMIRKSFFILLLLSLTLVSFGCSGANLPQTNQELPQNPAQALNGNHFDLLLDATADVLKEKPIEALTVDEVYQKVVLEQDTNYLVVDIRSTEDFAKGSIEGAVNIPYQLTANPNLVEFLPKDKKIVVVCYSGHTAAQTVAYWKMLGYDAVPMLNGMGGWKTGAGTKLPDQTFNYPVTTEVPKPNYYELPNFTDEYATNIGSLITNRTQKYLATGKGAVINATEIKTNAVDNKDPNYFLVDIRDAADYAKGHVEGAINIPYQNITNTDYLRQMPTNKKVVLIGYTGTDASEIVRLLNQLGYDSYAMLQGMRVWTSDAAINGIAPVTTENVPEYPLKPLDYDINSSGSGGASCG